MNLLGSVLLLIYGRMDMLKKRNRERAEVLRVVLRRKAIVWSERILKLYLWWILELDKSNTLGACVTTMAVDLVSGDLYLGNIHGACTPGQYRNWKTFQFILCKSIFHWKTKQKNINYSFFEGIGYFNLKEERIDKLRLLRKYLC